MKKSRNSKLENSENLLPSLTDVNWERSSTEWKFLSNYSAMKWLTTS